MTNSLRGLVVYARQRQPGAVLRHVRLAFSLTISLTRHLVIDD